MKKKTIKMKSGGKMGACKKCGKMGCTDKMKCGGKKK